MTVLRSALFNLAFFGWTALYGLMGLPVLAAPPRAVTGFIRFWAGGVAWLLERIVGLTVTVRGRENIPAGAAVIASKHQSAWDTIMFYRILPDPVYVLKQELVRIPIYGWFASRSGVIAIDRKGGGKALRNMVRDARAALAKGRQVVIFPEGTRSAPGSRLPYQPGVAALYTQLDAPVVPVALNSGLFWGRRSFIKSPGCIAIEFLPPISPGLDRERFLAELEDRIETATAELVAGAAVGEPVDRLHDRPRGAL